MELPKEPSRSNIFEESYERVEEGKEFISSEEAIETFPIGNDFYRLEVLKESSGRKLIFIDGGIQELYKKGRTAFYAIKVAYASFSSNIRKENKVYSSIARIDRVEEDGKSFKIALNDSFPFISNIKDDFYAEEWEESIGNFRREMELNLALFLSKENRGATIIIDGSLFPKKNDEGAIRELIKENKERNALIGISKSSSMKTNKGNNAIDLVFELSRKKGLGDDAWIYFPLFYGKEGLKTACIRFHKRAAMCFRVDFLNPSPELTPENKESIDELMLNSIDGVFLGYPYGLIYVDRIARIGNNEADFLRMKYFISKKKETIDAHSILDNIS
ncbi:MAG: hypothetical protein PWR30_149 [Candidatus Woesearchaeota archaeon]|nr:hypothetical protein [Candidatus Woesearchaeota archaeon]